MYSPKRSLIPTTPKSVTYSYSNRNILRKKCAFTQTNRNSYLDLFQGSDILIFDEESKKIYALALEYINKFHNLMNKELNEKYGECGDANMESTVFFKLPEIPNYANIFQMLLEKTKYNSSLLKNTTEEINRNTDVVSVINKPSIIEFITDISESKTLETHFKSNQILNIKNNKPNFEKVRKLAIPEIPVSLSNKSDFIEREEDLNYVEKVVIYSQNLVADQEIEENNTIVESNNTLDSEKFIDNDLTEDESLKELTEERIKKSSNDESKYINRVIEKDMTNTEKKNFMDVVKKRVEEEFLTYLNKNNTEKSRDTRLVKSNFNIVTIQPQINLLEYAQKKLERQTNLEVNSSKSVNTCNELHHDKYFSTCNSPERNYNTPKRIRDMFKKISQENFESKADNCTTHINIFEDESDSDSIILDDEEFEKLNRGFQEKQTVDDDEFKIKGFQQKSELKKEGRQKKINSGHRQEKCHPLKLNGKDMTRIDDKMLSAIGLFTERGDIRPGIIDILEEQKKVKSKDFRNKQFRTKRQWDLQIHLEPKTYLRPSLTSISSDKSFISLSSDIKSEIGQNSGNREKFGK